MQHSYSENVFNYCEGKEFKTLLNYSNHCVMKLIQKRPFFHYKIKHFLQNIKS